MSVAGSVKICWVRLEALDAHVGYLYFNPAQVIAVFPNEDDTSSLTTTLLTPIGEYRVRGDVRTILEKLSYAAYP